MNLEDEAVATASIKFFEAAFEQDIMRLAIRSADPKNLRWLRVNQKFCDIVGYSEDE